MPMSQADPMGQVDALLAQARAARENMRVTEGLSLTRQAWACLEDLEAANADGAWLRTARAEVGQIHLRFLFYAGDSQAAMAFGKQLLPLIDDPALTPLRCDVLRGMAAISMEVADFGNGLELAMASHALAEGLDSAQLMCGALSVIGECFNRLGDQGQAERVLLEALEQADRLPGLLDRFVVTNALCETSIDAFLRHRDTGDMDRARDSLERAHDHARALWPAAQTLQPQNQALNIVAQGNLGVVRLHRGDLVGARRLLGAALEIAEAHGLQAHAWYARCALAECEMKEGRWKAGYDKLKDLLAQRQDKDGGPGVRRVHHALYLCCKQLALLAEALTHLEAYQAKEAQRISAHLVVQTKLFVSRLETDQVRRQAEAAQVRRLEEERQVLMQAADTDPLTGLGNRRLLASRAPVLIQQAADSGRPVHLAILDLDHFKQINDTFGHAAGDDVLVHLAQILRDHTRADDLLVRLGGEEFLVMLLGADELLAQRICERLRAAVEQHDWSVLDPRLRVTSSLGLARGLEHRLEELMARADAALYRAKREGRNRVCTDELTAS